jgi:uncharacterized protein
MTSLPVRRGVWLEVGQMDAEVPLVERPARACFMVCAWDGPDAARLRDRDLEEHLAHVEAHWQDYLIAGPLRHPGQDGLCGSLLLVFADTEAGARELIEADPYFSNGQYTRVEITHFVPSIGTAIGGKIWPSASALRNRTGGTGAQAGSAA